MKKMSGDMGEIFRRYLPSYLETNKLSAHQSKVLGSVMKCRTSALGYQLYECDECGHVEMIYNACRDRHCPKCQWKEQQNWVAEKLEELPKVGYHHVVMTLPDQIHHLAMINKRVIYQMVFEAGAETLQVFGRDKRHLGAEIGAIGVLHTWGQTLNYHIHVHFLVTAGGLNKDGNWIDGRYGDKFLFPVRAMSQVFRGKFISKLRKAKKNDILKLEGKINWMNDLGRFEWFVSKLAGQMFRVHSKGATQNPDQVVKYLGAYMKRGPIGNGRIISIENGEILFRYRDHRNGGVKKVCRMKVNEFIRRWTSHILPKGFVKVRYYGLFAGSNRKEKMERIRSLAGHLMIDEEIKEPKCPKCEKGKLIVLPDIAWEKQWIELVAYQDSS
jgi:predicted Zn-ribbon and HTH transcriptional regulator